MSSSHDFQFLSLQNKPQARKIREVPSWSKKKVTERRFVLSS